MYFALLVTQLPHLSDARGNYPNVPARAGQSQRARRVHKTLARGLAGVLTRLKRVG